jgi:hypothetical protein
MQGFSCPICGDFVETWSTSVYCAHVCQHMEQIAFAIVTKPYEDWDFYTDNGSVACIAHEDNSPPVVPDEALSKSQYTQENSKQSSDQEKHKCNVCEKRFTRPSSLRTHTYSHKGVKPYRGAKCGWRDFFAHLEQEGKSCS